MNAKPFWKSATFQGLFISALGLLLIIAARNGWIAGKDASDIVEFIGYIAQTVGLPYAGYGRYATKGENLVLKKPDK